MPKEEPLCRRPDLRRRAPRRQIVATVISAPATSPGKKPTSIAVMGNLSQESAVSGTVPFLLVTGTTDADCVLIDIVGDAAAEVREEEDAGAGGGRFCWSAFITHRLCVLQL